MQTSKVIKNLVEYSGINSVLPNNPTIFTQFNISQNLCVPTQKPDIERLLKVNTQIFIDDYKIIKTPVGTSLEGQILTGNKVIAYGRILYTIMYVANKDDQSVHSAHFEIPFCRFIVLPVGFSLYTPIKIIPYIENVSACLADLRCIDVCATIFLNVVTCVCCSNTTNGCSGTCKDSCTTMLGIAKTFPQNPLYFKEIMLEDELVIPKAKPDIEGIVSITSDIQIVSTRIVSTDQKRSLEGQNLSGCKLIIELKQIDILVYTANEPTQSLHSAHYESSMNSVFVIVPCQINGVDIQTLLDECRLKVNTYIEDVCVKVKDLRTAKKCLVLFININPITF